ncbi:hypothetical protein HZS_6971 [Henneguya salminicola]|nr:hypothetical protein HZS_6971 [Henneguya salminicola]
MKAPESFIPIFCGLNEKSFRKMSQEFKKISEKTLHDYIKEFYNGNYEKMLRAICTLLEAYIQAFT